MNTSIFHEFEASINQIEEQLSSSDDFLRKLLFANIVTAFEVYLHDIFINLLENNNKLLIKLTESDSYKNSKITWKQALTNDMSRYIIVELKSLVFHNLSIIEPLFNKILGITIDYKKDTSIIDIIDVRHDVVHRNGLTKEGQKRNFSKEYLETVLSKITNLVTDIDRQVIEKYKL